MSGSVCTRRVVSRPRSRLTLRESRESRASMMMCTRAAMIFDIHRRHWAIDRFIILCVTPTIHRRRAMPARYTAQVPSTDSEGYIIATLAIDKPQSRDLRRLPCPRSTPSPPSRSLPRVPDVLYATRSGKRPLQRPVSLLELLCRTREITHIYFSLRDAVGDN